MFARNSLFAEFASSATCFAVVSSAVGLFRRLFRVHECDGRLVALGVELLQVRRHLVQAVGQLAELVAPLERNHRVPIARANPDGAALEQTDRLGDGMSHGHRAQEDEQGAGGKTHDTQVDDAPGLVGHRRVLGEQDLTACVGDGIHDRDELALGLLELLVPLNDR